jgi:hypothetical protein
MKVSLYSVNLLAVIQQSHFSVILKSGNFWSGILLSGILQCYFAQCVILWIVVLFSVILSF